MYHYNLLKFFLYRIAVPSTAIRHLPHYAVKLPNVKMPGTAGDFILAGQPPPETGDVAPLHRNGTKFGGM